MDESVEETVTAVGPTGVELFWGGVTVVVLIALAITVVVLLRRWARRHAA